MKTNRVPNLLCCHCVAAWSASKVQVPTWEFQKIRGALFGCPYNKDPTV